MTMGKRCITSRVKSLTILALVALGSAGCSNEPSSPRAVFKAYVETVQKEGATYDDVIRFFSAKHKEYKAELYSRSKQFSVQQQQGGWVSSEGLRQKCARNEIVSESINEPVATLIYRRVDVCSDRVSPVEEKVDFVMENGTWKIDRIGRNRS